jgi:hypothetical protein
MKVRCCASLLITAVMITSSAFAQKRDSTYLGSVKGFVYDSVHNYVLPSATLSVFKIEDASLLSYQLSNTFGEFKFKDLPTGIPLRIVASYTGYNNLIKTFTIPAGAKEIDLKALVVERSNGELKEIVIPFIPPVRMNGDTLEFNADAFKLDSNAVVEDLLRKLPGITVWGDGAITANGKKINSVLVDGKPFFGGDIRVATQNLPKNAIDKIQVYQQKNELNPLDSATSINIKLKKNKKTGYFGKLGAGYGTRNRFEADASLNIYSPKTQFGIVAAGNNTNKPATDLNTLLRNASYKGVGASTNYQTNFKAPGTNRAKEAGFFFQHDFIADAGYEKKNRITANYFVTNNNNFIKSNTRTITNLTGDSSLLQTINSETDVANTSHRFDSKYEFSTQKRALTISPSFNINNSKSSSLQQRTSAGSDQQLLSIDSTRSAEDAKLKNITLNVGYLNYGANNNSDWLPKNYLVDYTFYAGTAANNLLNKTAFVSLSDPAQNKNFDRKYDNNSNDVNQTLSLKVNDLKRMFFHNKKFAGIDFQLQNNLHVNTHNEDNKVADKDSMSQEYRLNKYLTNKSTYNTFNYLPGLGFTKYFNKQFANRYYKTIYINVLAQVELYHQKNVSEKTFQNFEHNYSEFIPGATISYTNNQLGDHQATYSLDYKTSSEFPGVDQLAPLVDSSNIWHIQKGNPELRSSYKQELTFNFQNFSLKPNYIFFYDLHINAGNIKNDMVDSSFYDNLGRTTRYIVNANGHKYLSAGGNLNRAFKFKEHQLQVTIRTDVSIAKTPNYINSVLILPNTFSNNTGVTLNYNFKNLLAIYAAENLSFFYSAQNGADKNGIESATKSTNFSASANFTKKLSLSSNITYNRNTFTRAMPIDYTIWNASTRYRFLKGNNAEIKLSALDLLHQNKSVYISGIRNAITRSTLNVLQQYFIITFSYFPRKFGKNEK